MPGLNLENFTALITAYGYFVILPIAILEGPILAVLSGFLASMGYLNPVIVFLILLAGDGIGDFIYYFLGRWAKHGLIHRLEKYIGATDEKLEKLKKYYQKHNWKIIAFSKTQPFGAVFLTAAGMAEMPFKKYIFYALLGSAPKVLLFEGIGYFFGKSIVNAGKFVDYAGIASFFVAVLLAAAYYFYLRFAKKQIENI
ncbi:MAG: DedA family protein [bacterium]|nr:DedA family protein [bacterium]